MILDGKFNNSLLQISFIKSSIERVSNEIRSIVFETLNKKWQEKQFKLLNSSRVSSLISISHFNSVNVILWQPRAINFDLTIFLTNMPDGWQSLIDIYFNKSGSDIIQVALSDSKKEYPVYSFECKTISGRRLVRSMKDSDKWEFFEKGSIMQFENKEYYKKRKIADRMNNEIIIEYLKKNQIDITQEEFWVSRGEAIEFSTNLKEQ